MKKQPKYVEIFNYYKDQIENNHLEYGTPLPMEEEIQNKFDASHMTIAKAFNELHAKGYIKRIKGKGTYVDNSFKVSIQKLDTNLLGITEVIRNSGLEPSCELIKYEILKAKAVPHIQQKFNLRDDQYLHFFIRTRYGNDSLICISYTYINQDIIPNMDIKALEGSLTDFLKEKGIIRTTGRSEIRAALPDEFQSKIIGSNHVPLLKQTRSWFCMEGFLEETVHYFLGDKFSVVTDLVDPTNIGTLKMDK